MSVLTREGLNFCVALHAMTARMRFIQDYCIERNWDPDELSLDQILEIRSQTEWRLFCDSESEPGPEFV